MATILQPISLYCRSEALREDGSGVVAQPEGTAGAAAGAVGPGAGRGGGSAAQPALRLPYNATLSPLQVHLPSHPPRPPTLAECEAILTHLHNTNERQAHEVSDETQCLYNSFVAGHRECFEQQLR